MLFIESFLHNYVFLKGKESQFFSHGGIFVGSKAGVV